MDNFDVSYSKGVTDDGTTVVTSFTSYEDVLKEERRILSEKLTSYQSKTGKDQYSVFTNETVNSNKLTLDTIDNLASGINSTLDNVLSANQLILRYVIEDGMMGYTYSAVMSNINTDYKIKYDGIDKEGKRSNDYVKIKTLIDNFNEAVDLKTFIKDAISMTYLEGNCVNILRYDDTNPVIDLYPLTIAYPSDYKKNGNRIIEVSIDNIKTKLQKTHKKTKTKKAVYFENMLKEISANFPAEVVNAYRNNEKYVRLDVKNSDCITINSMGRKFGVSPFFKALRPLIVLNNLEEADISDSKARSKKIIYQKLRKELLGKDYNLRGLAEQELAHSSLMSALKTNFCAYTSPAFVESVEFVTSKSNNEDAVNQMRLYTSKFLQSLGISFIDNEAGNYSIVNISIKQLIKIVNYIIGDIERVINKYYKTILEINNIDPYLAPKIKIASAEEMELEVKKELATFCYNTLGISRKTTFEMVGIDLDDEIEKRKDEKENGLDEIFVPYNTSFNKSGDNKSVGRPSTQQDLNKQQDDKDYNDNVR